jgi:uncharacterized phage protein (TIGR01671 family)
MSEIEFRAWDVGEKNWIEPSNISLYLNTEDKLLSFGVGGIASSGIEFVQFTGLLDKNEKKIFVGDIVTWFADGINKKAIVKWKFHGYVAERIGKDKNGFDREYEFQSFIPIVEDKFDGEVIGNIYENPTLLEDKE